MTPREVMSELEGATIDGALPQLAPPDATAGATATTATADAGATAADPNIAKIQAIVQGLLDGHQALLVEVCACCLERVLWGTGVVYVPRRCVCDVCHYSGIVQLTLADCAKAGTF